MISERLRLLADLVPRGGLVVDVGAHHGHLAHLTGAIASERAPACVGRRDVPWVVADGLAAFRRVDVAILAGMGARTIHRILSAAPRPGVAVLHADDDPPMLRRLLAGSGWRIEAERLAGGDHRLAELIRAVPGDEPASDLWLDFGPRLLCSDDPLLIPHLQRQHQHWHTLATRVEPVRPDAAAPHRARARFLLARLTERGAPALT